MKKAGSKYNFEGNLKSFSIGSSSENETTLNCFNPSTEMTLLLQQLFLVNWRSVEVFTATWQQDFTFENTATSTIFDPQKWVSILNENVDKSTKSASVIEKTLCDTAFRIIQT